MSGIKTVVLEPKNHVFLKDLAYLKDSTIQKELNQIVSKKRKLEEVKILAS